MTKLDCMCRENFSMGLIKHLLYCCVFFLMGSGGEAVLQPGRLHVSGRRSFVFGRSLQAHVMGLPLSSSLHTGSRLILVLHGVVKTCRETRGFHWGRRRLLSFKVAAHGLLSIAALPPQSFCNERCNWSFYSTLLLSWGFFFFAGCGLSSSKMWSRNCFSQ